MVYAEYLMEFNISIGKYMYAYLKVGKRHVQDGLDWEFPIERTTQQINDEVEGEDLDDALLAECLDAFETQP